MPYLPKIKTLSDRLLIDNVLALVKRDAKGALDYFFAASAYPDFVERTVGRFFKQNYPSFAIDPEVKKPEQSADGSWMAGEFKVGLYLAVADADPPTVTRKAMDYAAALENLLVNASVADYTAGFPANSVFALTWDVSYEYGLIGKNATGWEKPVSFELLLKFNER